MDIIVTDVTKFTNPRCRCVAGLTPNGICYRPTDYFTLDECDQLSIVPGTVLRGNFVIYPRNEVPHTEDCSRANVTNAGSCSAAYFKHILENDCADSVEEGFDVDLSGYRKCIPEESAPNHSIITVKASAVGNCWFQTNDFNGRICFEFSDESGDSYRYMPIADLGVRTYIEEYEGDGVAHHLNQFIHAQNEIYLRIGVGRCYTANGRTGFWLQINGIYTFPGAIPGTRLTTN